MVRLQVDSSEWKQVQVGRITGPTQPGEALKILVLMHSLMPSKKR